MRFCLRILIVTTFFPPLNAIASLRPYSWAKYWTLAGHNVEVLTVLHDANTAVALRLPNPGFRVYEVPLPKFVERLKRGYQGKEPQQTSDKKGLLTVLKKGVVSIFNYLRHNKGVFNACRMPDFTDLWIRPAIHAMHDKGNWDLVVSTAGPYSVHVVAAHLKKTGRAQRWIADYRDTWSDNYVFPGLFPFNYIEKVLEKKLMQHADVITTVSAPFAKSLSVRYGNKVCVSENGFDSDDLDHLPVQSVFPDDGKFRIVHTGSIYLGKRDPRPLFEAIRKISQESSHILDRLEVVFVGLRQANLDELIHNYQVEPWVKSVGFVPREDALRMQRDAHQLLFLPWNDSSVDGVMTGKIYEYLFSGTPIMAVGGNGMEASQQLILDANAGEVFASTEQIVQFLQVNLSEKEKKKNTLNRAIVDHFDRKKLAMKLLEQGMTACPQSQ